MSSDEIPDARQPADQPLKRGMLTRAEAERWLNENAEAIESWNRWVEEHGLPLARWRMF